MHNYTTMEYEGSAITHEFFVPYTRFLDPKEFQALNSTDINGFLTGIGVQLEAAPQNNGFRVKKAIANSPALRAGIQPGDIVLAVDDHQTQGLSLDQVMRLSKCNKQLQR